MAETSKINALVLKSINFRERDRILTLFSRERGLVKAIAFGANSVKSAKRSLSDLLTRGEYIVRDGKGELLTLVEGKALDHHFQIRSNFDSLQAATKMAQILLHTQQENKAASPLYDLVTLLLRELGHSERPQNLLALFHLKLLRYEGMLSLGHLPFPVTDEERHSLDLLSSATFLGPVVALSLSPLLLRKIEGLTQVFVEQ